MWPLPGEALSRTVRCEAALAELWGAALARWVPSVRAAVLPAAPVRQVLTASGPSLTSGNVLPPDLGAVPQTSQAWRDAAVVLSAGVAALWCVEWWAAAAALGVELPAAVAEAWSGAGERGPDLNAAVARVIAANTDLTVREVTDRVAAVTADSALSATAAEFTAATTAEAVETTPQRFAVKLTAVLDGNGLPDDPAARIGVLRARAADALAVDSPLMRDYANAQSLDAAAIQNNAVVHAARYADGPLEKTWICVHPDTVVSAVGVTHLARRRYKGALYSVRTASGATVALTPQHRVLTGNGWVESQSLNVGDHLFKVVGVDPAGAPQVQHVPSRIGEIIDAAMNDAAAESRVMRCAVDFDVDTSGGYIEVVPVDGPLDLNRESLQGQSVRDFLLTDSDLLGHAAVLCAGGLDDRGFGFNPPAVFLPDAPVDVGFDVSRSAGGAHYASGGHIADGDPRGGEHFGDLWAGALIPLSDCVGRFPGRIGGDDVGGGFGQVGTAAGLDSEGLGSPHLRESGGVLGAQLPGLAQGAEDSVLAEAASNGLTADLKVGGDLLGRFPGEVAGGDGVGVDRSAGRPGCDVNPGGAQVSKYDTGAGPDGPCNVCGGFTGPVPGGDVVRFDGDFLVGDDPCGVEFAADSLPGGAVGFGDLVEGFTRSVAADRIIGIERVDHDGFVYDLSTASHFYLANELVISNCTIDGKTRATHFAADGQRVPLDGKFTVGHSQMDHPGDRSAPPAEYKNCRCRVGVLAPDEQIPDEVDRHTERLDGRDSVAINRHGRSQAEEIARREADGQVRAREDPEGIGVVAAAPAPATMTATGRQELSMAEDTGAELFRTFTDQAVAPIGVPTSDRRMLAAGIDLSFRSFPLPLMWKRQTGPGHDDAFTVGVIESGRVEGDRVLVSGYLLNTAEADEASEQNAHGVSQPSVDLADAEIIATDADGNELTEEQFWDAWENGTPVYETARAGEFIGTTLVATPAFDTRFVLNAEREARDIALVAAATITQRVYPAALFADPVLSGPTPTTVDADTGRIFGHLALWDGYHRGVGLEQVQPPRSPSNYSQFHTSPPLLLDDGRRLPVGRLTVGTGHAGLSLGGGPAMAHYDNTGTCFALVRMGEDRHGIWFSGVAAPWATPEQVEQGVSSPLSGDWRDFGLGRDLVAALAVNTPGFAVRSRTDDYGRPVALVASAGPLLRRGSRPGGGLSKAVVKAAVAEALAEAQTARELSALIDRSRAVVADPPTPAQRIAAMLAAADV